MLLSTRTIWILQIQFKYQSLEITFFFDIFFNENLELFESFRSNVKLMFQSKYQSVKTTFLKIFFQWKYWTIWILRIKCQIDDVSIQLQIFWVVFASYAVYSVLRKIFDQKYLQLFSTYKLYKWGGLRTPQYQQTKIWTTSFVSTIKLFIRAWF